MVIAAAIAAFCCFCCYWCYCCCCCCYCVFFTEMCCNADNLFRLALFYIQTDTCSQLHSHILRQQTNALLTNVSHTFALHFLYTLRSECFCRIIALSSVLQLQLYMFRVCPVLYTYSSVQYVCASRFFSLLIFHVSFHLICNEISRRVVFICNCLLCLYIMSSEWKKKQCLFFFPVRVFKRSYCKRVTTTMKTHFLHSNHSHQLDKSIHTNLCCVQQTLRYIAFHR